MTRKKDTDPKAKFDRSAFMKARARTPEGQAATARRVASNHTPEARAKRAATVARNKARREAGATSPDQQEFYYVHPDGGPVQRWWIVPNTFNQTLHGPAESHPCGEGPAPGWYDADGKALSRDPRTVVL